MVCRVCEFLEGGFDHRHRTLPEILAKNDGWLESTHDYIQWLFPLDVKSGSSHEAPILTIDDILRINDSEKAQINIAKSVERMIDFWSDNDYWITRYNHNHLRITRVIKSLRLTAGAQSARDFQEWLKCHIGRRFNEIDPKAINLWDLRDVG
jgi:hypothetical protein